MADNTTFTPGTGATLALDDIGGVLHQRVKVEFGADGAATDVSAADPLPVTGPLTDAALRAADVKITLDGEAVKPVAGDGNPSEFSMAVVGAHINVATATLASKQTYTKPEGATALLAQNTGTKNIRFTLDGTDPTASLGFVLPYSQMPVLLPCPGAAIEMIREADGGALDAQWVK